MFAFFALRLDNFSVGDDDDDDDDFNSKMGYNALNLKKNTYK